MLMTNIVDLLNHKQYQRQEISQKIKAIFSHIESIQFEKESLQQTITAHENMLRTLVPEQEMARLNFIVSQKNKQDELTFMLNQHIGELDLLQLSLSKIQANIQLLEQYLNKQKEEQIKREDIEMHEMIDIQQLLKKHTSLSEEHAVA